MTGPPARRGCSPSTFASVVSARAEEDDGYTRLEVRVDSVSVEHPPDTDSRSRDAAIRTSFIGTHLILEAVGARFVTVVDPPTSAAAAARRCGVRSIPDLQRHRRIRRM